MTRQTASTIAREPHVTQPIDVDPIKCGLEAVNDAPRYIRHPEADKRVTRGDCANGDAWLDTETGEVKFLMVGFDANSRQWLSRSKGSEP